MLNKIQTLDMKNKKPRLPPIELRELNENLSIFLRRMLTRVFGVLVKQLK